MRLVINPATGELDEVDTNSGSGSTGPQGPQGPSGPQGEPGDDGLDGLPGPQGPAGTTGATGSAGPTGATGAAGPAGDDGEDGQPGEPGAPGPAGVIGPSGPSGQDGEDGQDGMPGAAGPAGATGATGAAGATGSTGPTGLPGLDGDDGEPGLTGLPGPPGPASPIGSVPILFADADVDETLSFARILSNIIVGSGVKNQVAFWSTPTTLDGDADFTWDSSTNVLLFATGAAVSFSDVGIARNAAAQLRVTNGGAGTGDILFSDMTGTGAAHVLGTAGTTTLLTVGQGAAGADNARVEILAGSGGGRAELDLSNGSTTLVRVFSDGTATTFEYNSTLSFKSGPAGPTRVSIAAAGETTISSGPARQLTFNNASAGRSSFVDSAHAATLDYTLPSAITASGFLQTDSGGALSWVTAATAGVVSGTGVAGQVAFWTSTTAIGGDADFTWDSTTNALVFATTATVSWGDIGLARNAAGVLRITDGSTGVGDIRFKNMVGTGPTQTLGTAGTTTILTVGQGAAGVDNAQIVAQCGSGGGSTVFSQTNGAGSRTRWLDDGTNTTFEYGGTWTIKAGVAGTSRLTIASTGETTILSGPARQLVLNNASGGRSSFVDSAHAATLDYTFPTAITTSGFLKTTAGGVLSWATITDADVPDTITLSNITQITTRSHASLQDLVSPADDHTQYTKLAGRTGITNDTLLSTTVDGTLYGSHMTAKGLILVPNDVDTRSTSTALVTADGLVTLYPSLGVLPALTAVLKISPTGVDITASRTFQGIDISPTIVTSGSLLAANITAINSALTVNNTGDAFNVVSIQFMNAAPISTSAVAANRPRAMIVFYDQASTTFSSTGTCDGSAGQDNIAFFNQSNIKNLSTGTLKWRNIYGFRSAPSLVSNDSGGTLTVTNRIAVSVADVGYIQTGAVTLTNNIGVDLADMVVGASGSPARTVTNVYGVKSALSSGTNRWFIYADGSAASAHKGKIRIGDNTAPTLQLEVGVGAITGTIDTMTYASPISLDVTLGNLHKTTTVNATGSVTINASAAGTAGQHIWVLIINDATSGKTITFGTNFKPSATVVGTVSKAAMVHFVSDGVNWYEVARTLGL